eukprot:SAG11_NODE_31667_length_290_cov_0.696335_1_plen_67_part_01
MSPPPGREGSWPWLILLEIVVRLLPGGSAEDGSEAWLRYRLAAPARTLNSYRAAIKTVSVICVTERP